MGETLVALGRSYEEEGKIDEARKAYHNCLSIIPFHEEAQHSLEFLQNKNNTNKNVLGSDDLLLPNLTKAVVPPVVPNSAAAANEQLKQFLRNEEEEKKEKKKKKKSKRKRKHHSSSSSSSSGSSGSSHSSSSSSSSSSDSSSGSSDSDSKSKKKKRKSRKERHEKQKSLSPLSKRMAHDTPTSFQFNKPAASASFDFGFEQAVPEQPAKSAVTKEMEFNSKLRSFFETHNASDSDYEERVSIILIFFNILSVSDIRVSKVAIDMSNKYCNLPYCD